MNSCLFLSGAITLGPFDWQPGLIVGSIAFVAAAGVLAVGIATSVIVLPWATTLLQTALAVGSISGVVGVSAGAAAGFYWGHKGEIKHRELRQTVANVSSQLDIYFEPLMEDKDKAADFRCNVVYYEGTDLSTTPTVTTKHTSISAANAEEFFRQVDCELKRWFAKRIAADTGKTQRRVTIYMKPFPGEGIYEKLKKLAEQNGPCIVNQLDCQWSSALAPDRTAGQ